MGTLLVQQSRILGGLYIDGAVAYVEVRSETGTEVARVEDRDYHVAKEIARVGLPPGRYVVWTYVRPCEAACPALGGPMDGCQLSLDVVAGGLVQVRVERQPGRPCQASLVD